MFFFQGHRTVGEDLRVLGSETIAKLSTIYRIKTNKIYLYFRKDCVNFSLFFDFTVDKSRLYYIFYIIYRP